MKRTLALGVPGLLFAVTIRPTLGQSLGNAGTIEGTVVDASGAVVAKAATTLHNALTNYAGFAFSVLTPHQQVTIGLACNGVLATVANPISDCVGLGGKQGTATSKLLTPPQGGYDNFPSAENDDHNPDRVKPRNLLDLGLGTDNLLHTEKRQRVTASVAITNITNKVALYNFLSTFSGTHFLQPRMLVGRIGFAF